MEFGKLVKNHALIKSFKAFGVRYKTYGYQYIQIESIIYV